MAALIAEAEAKALIATWRYVANGTRGRPAIPQRYPNFAASLASVRRRRLKQVTSSIQARLILSAKNDHTARVGETGCIHADVVRCARAPRKRDKPKRNPNSPQQHQWTMTARAPPAT